MNCVNCEARNPAKARFCRRCGSVMTLDASSPTVALVKPQSGMFDGVAKWAGYLFIGMILLGVLL